MSHPCLPSVLITLSTMASLTLAGAQKPNAAPNSTPPSAPKKAAAPAASPHKSKVPVTVTTVFGEGKATVRLRFDQAVTGATIGFRGLDGLTIISATEPKKAQFKRGETLVVELKLAQGLGQSHLAVDIEGTFRGQHRMGVQTFALGKPTAEQEKAAAGQVVTTSEGQRIRIMPVPQ